MELGILSGRRDGDGIALALVAIHLHLAGQGVGATADHLVGLLFQPAVGILLVVDGIAFGIGQRVNKHHLALMAEHGVEALRTEIETARLYRRSRIMTLEGQDIGILGGKIGGQQVIGLQREGHFPSVRQGQGQLAPPGLQAGKVIEGHLGHPKLVRPHLITVGRRGARRHRAPLLGRKAARAHQAGHNQRQGRIFHQLHLFSPFKCTHLNNHRHHFPAGPISPAPSSVHSPNGECCANPV